MPDIRDIRDTLLTKAIEQVNVEHNNRAAHIEASAVDRTARADAKRVAKRDLREAKRKQWCEWTAYREFARREAKAGRYVLPVGVEIPKTRVCVACSVHQCTTAFTLDPHVCDTCQPQVDATRARLATLHASLARAKKVRKPGDQLN